jgi:hypothetical protein
MSKAGSIPFNFQATDTQNVLPNLLQLLAIQNIPYLPGGMIFYCGPVSAMSVLYGDLALPGQVGPLALASTPARGA